MNDFTKWLLGVSEEITQADGSVVRRYHGDIIFNLLVVLPLTLGVSMLLFQTAGLAVGYWNTRVFLLMWYSLLFAGVMSLGGKRVSPDTIGIYQFVGMEKYFLPCMVFAPRIFGFTLLLAPYGQEVFTKWTKSPVQASSGRTHDVWLKVNVSYHVDAEKSPRLVKNSFSDELRTGRDEAYRVKDKGLTRAQRRDLVLRKGLDNVNTTVLLWMKVFIDPVTMCHSVKQIMEQRPVLNQDLTTTIQGQASRFAIVVERIMIQDITDLIGLRGEDPENTGITTNYALQTRAADTADRKIVQAKEDRRSRKVAAKELRNARVAEEKSQQVIAGEERETAEKRVQVRLQEALAGVQTLEQRMRIVKEGGWALALLQGVIEAPAPELVKYTSEAIQFVAHQRSEGGAIVNVGSSGNPAVDRLVEGIADMLVSKLGTSA